MKLNLFSKITGFSAIAAIIIVTSILTGCQKEVDLPVVVDSQRANEIASGYLELSNNQYILNLSETEAMSLGVSKSDYDRMQIEIRQTNAYIAESVSNGAKITLGNPSKIDNSRIRLKSNNEQEEEWTKLGSFKMPASGGGGSTSVYIPSGVTSIRISVSVTCLIGSGYGVVKCFGQDISYSCAGLSGGSTMVKLPASGLNVTITGNTVCSGGGTVTVEYEK